MEGRPPPTLMKPSLQVTAGQKKCQVKNYFNISSNNNKETTKIDGLSKKVPGEQLSYCFFKQQQKLTVGQQVCTQVVLVSKILRNICSQKIYSNVKGPKDFKSRHVKRS